MAWARSILILGLALRRPASPTPLCDVLLGFPLAIPMACLGVTAAVASTVGTWTWPPMERQDGVDTFGERGRRCLVPVLEAEPDPTRRAGELRREVGVAGIGGEDRRA